MPPIPVIERMSMSNLALPQSVTLRNGVPLHIIRGGVHDVVRIDLLFRGGYKAQQQPLQALFTNRMLREGTADFSSTEISRRLDYYGAWIDMYSSQECNHITLYTLGKHIEPMLELLASMVMRPLFPHSNLATVRDSNKAFFKINSQKVDVLAQRHFERMLWGGNHPLGHIVCAEDYDAIKRGVLVDYHSKMYGSDTLNIFLSGNIDAGVEDAVARCFGEERWGGTHLGDVVLPAPSPIYGHSKVNVDSVLQSGVKVGCMVMDADDDDFLKFRFLTVLLGGYFGSRLMSNIRERNGYTYHIDAELDAYGCRNAFMISTETANEYVEPLLKEVYAEMKRLREEEVSAEELELVRNYTLGELCREYEGVLPKSEVFINVWLAGRPFEAVNEYLDVVRTIDSGEMKRLACKYLSKDAMSEIVVGL